MFFFCGFSRGVCTTLRQGEGWAMQGVWRSIYFPAQPAPFFSAVALTSWYLINDVTIVDRLITPYWTRTLILWLTSWWYMIRLTAWTQIHSLIQCVNILSLVSCINVCSVAHCINVCSLFHCMSVYILVGCVYECAYLDKLYEYMQLAQPQEWVEFTWSIRIIGNFLILIPLTYFPASVLSH